MLEYRTQLAMGLTCVHVTHKQRKSTAFFLKADYLLLCNGLYLLLLCAPTRSRGDLRGSSPGGGPPLSQMVARLPYSVGPGPVDTHIISFVTIEISLIPLWYSPLIWRCFHVITTETDGVFSMPFHSRSGRNGMVHGLAPTV